jgi:hypothetical protein
VWTSKALYDPVNKALLQLEYAPGYPSRRVGGEELSPEDYDKYVERAGKASHDGLSDLVASPEWKKLDDEAKVEAARKLVTNTRKAVRGELFGGDAKASPTQDDEWPGADAAKGADAWPGQDMQQRDIVGDLERAIPGLSFTSGYRTPEYQADMRRRGYKPADNSGHLDGSSLDIIVPAGKSMGWLMRKVKRVSPDAKLLPEGDHLHATFPGWYGAPVLGGAVKAGLHNPMAGR